MIWQQNTDPQIFLSVLQVNSLLYFAEFSEQSR